MKRSQRRVPKVGKSPAEQKTTKPKLEFKKKLLIWSLVATSICIAASYILSACGLESVSEIATSMIETCLGAIVGYCIATLGEKHSRNKYGIDPDGNPIPAVEEEDVEQEFETNGGNE